MMNRSDYVRDKLPILLIHAFGMIILSLFFRSIGNTKIDIILIDGIWIFVLILYFSVDYNQRKKYFDQIFTQLKELDQPYLISEVLDASYRLEDNLYREVLHRSNKSVIERMNHVEAAEKEYKEYIEQWIHDIKLPLTAARLICENRPAKENQALLLELGRIEKQVEQALFYARMENVYQDYMIHPVDLRKTILLAIAENKPYFILNNMQIVLDMDEQNPCIVSTDEKWVVFLLNQIFSNCIKYRKESHAVIRIYAKRENAKIILVIEDNGIGIAKEDRKRIFDKGFTGKNGRVAHSRSTGIGLYLSKRLCDKLGIGLTSESEENEYTRISFIFPDSDFQKLH